MKKVSPFFSFFQKIARKCVMKFAQKNFQGDFFSFISDKNVIFYEVCKIAEILAVLRPTLF